MANKNEAKIKFTAETGEFNNAIKKASNETSKLKAELKLNEAQMKNTGNAVEGLTNKKKLLSAQLEQAQNKTEALSQKLDKAVEIFGANSEEVGRLERQLVNARTEEEKLKTAITQCNSELQEAERAASDAENATESLTDKIDRQQTELKQLKSEYIEAVDKFGDTSEEAQRLAREIEDLSGELKQSKDAFDDASKKADELDQSMDGAGDAAAGSADGFTIAKGAIADLASAAIQLAIEKVAEFIGYLAQLPEATRELRQDLATLDTSFEKQGFTVDQAKETWKDLYTVFGEDDRAVEAANLIAKMSDNQQDLNDWVLITQGIWGTYQDSLPVEGLAEASNETAKTGKVTGVLADALNWSSEAATMFAKYMGEDVTTAEDAFNEALAECTTEQERQALITETLTALYGDAAAKYEEASGSQLEAKEAAAELALAETELANAIEPATTAWDGMKTALMVGVLPAVEAVSGAFVGVMEWAKEHPVAMQAIAAAVGVLAVALTALAVVVGVYTVAQWAMNAAILANPITWIIVGIVAAIAALAAVIVIVINYWDEISAAAVSAWEWIKGAWATAGEWFNTTVIQPVVSFFSGLWEGISTGAQAAWDWIVGVWASVSGWFDANVIQPIINFFTGLWDGIVNIWNGISNAVQVGIMLIGSILSAAFQIITLPWRFIWENCKDTIINIWNGIKTAVSNAINAVKNTITTVWNAIKAVMTPILNGIKTVVTTVWNAIKSVTSSVFNSVKSVATSVWNGIKTAVQTAVNAAKSVVTSVWNGIKSVTSSVFNGIKSVATSVWNGIKSTITSVVNGIKSTVTSVFNNVKSTATSVWNGIKTAITKPIDAAKTHVKNAVDAIVGFFKNMKISFPKIKLPHFSISGSFSLDPPSVPKLSVEWYAKGGILTKPTIFGINGNSFMAGGEAGPEAILPIDRLEGYITGAIEKTMQVVNLDTLAAAVEDLANRPIEMNINGRQFAVATAGDSDRVSGLRSTFKSRGLELD